MAFVRKCLGRVLGRGLERDRRNAHGFGPGGQCVCPSCGNTTSHTRGVPCYGLACPQCGASMVRKQNESILTCRRRTGE